MSDDEVMIRRSYRAGHRGLVAEVFLAGRPVGLIHLSGTTPPTEFAELWTADAVEGPNEFLTEQEAIVRTVGQARRSGGLRRRPGR